MSFGEGCAGKFPGIYSKLTEPQTLQWVTDYLADTGSNTCLDLKWDSRRSGSLHTQQDDYNPENYVDNTQSDWMQYIEDDVDVVV